MFRRSEEEPEGPATGLIKRRHKGRRETRIVFQKLNKDRDSRKREQKLSQGLLEGLLSQRLRVNC